MGEAKMEKVTWTVSPSVSPKGTNIQLHIEHSEGSSAWIYMDAEQAFDLAAELSHAAEWAKRKDAA